MVKLYNPRPQNLGSGDLAQSALWVAVIQAAVVVLLGVGLLIWTLLWPGSGASGQGLMLAALYGGLLGMVSTWLSKRSVERAARAAIQSTSLAMVPVYVGLLNKLLIVGGGLAIGLIALRLSPVSVVAGYILSQLAPVLLVIRRAGVPGE